MTRLALILLALPLTASALDVMITVDGEVGPPLRAASVEIVTDGEQMRIDVSTAATPPPRPEPPPPTGCDPRPPGVTIGDPINWASPGGQQKFTVVGTLAWPFRTTSNPAYAGQVTTVKTSDPQESAREMWISRCAGGAPLPGRCESPVGEESVVVRWAQNRTARGVCSLDTNTSYYVNVRCLSERCPVFRNIYHNQRP